MLTTPIELARRGDPRAFEDLVRPHLDSVRRFAYSFSHDWAEADDLAQEALVKAFRSLDRFDGRSSLLTWLYAVAKHVFIDSLRGRAHRMRLRETELDTAAIAAGDTQDVLLERKQATERLWAALRQLDPMFRTAVVLVDVEGMSYEEVAEVEGIPIGTVRSRVARGRARLVELVRGMDGPNVRAGTEPTLTSSDALGRTAP
jgi:RNA polymerase sigma-70 factor (ECF subfamily)